MFGDFQKIYGNKSFAKHHELDIVAFYIRRNVSDAKQPVSGDAHDNKESAESHNIKETGYILQADDTGKAA